MALPPKQRERIKALIQAGKLSKRAISRQEKVTRTTIDKIEKELLYPKPEKPKLPPPRLMPRKDKVVWVLCPKCRRKLIEHSTCLYCHTQKRQLVEYDSYMSSLLQEGS